MIPCDRAVVMFPDAPRSLARSIHQRPCRRSVRQRSQGAPSSLLCRPRSWLNWSILNWC